MTPLRTMVGAAGALLIGMGSVAGAQVVTGHYLGNGASNRAISGLGFEPDIVLLKGDLDSGVPLKTRSMPAGWIKVISSNNALQPDGILSLDPDGFTVDNGWRANKPATDYWYAAIKTVPGAVVEGSYVGDGTDDRNIGGLGLQPDFVLVASELAESPYWRNAAMPEGRSVKTHEQPLEVDRIQRFHPDGFQVGSDASVNATGAAYFYLAFRAVEGWMATGAYLGDGQDDRSITGAGFRPELVVVKADAFQRGIFRPASMIGDFSLPLFASIKAPDAIQGIEPDGFQLGTAPEVNSSSVMHYWMAVGAGVPAVGSTLSVQVTPESLSVGPGESFTLEGSVTRAGAEVAVAQWRWEQLEGPTGTRLLPAASQQLALPEPGRYRFRLVVVDQGGNTSPPAISTIRVSGEAYSPQTSLSGCAVAGGALPALGLWLWALRSRRRVRPRP